MNIFAGTFGQKESWDITNTGTYQHPLAPKDVLLDPLTIPTLTQMEDEKFDDSEGREGKKPFISDIESDSAEEEDKVKRRRKGWIIDFHSMSIGNTRKVWTEF